MTGKLEKNKKMNKVNEIIKKHNFSDHFRQQSGKVLKLCEEKKYDMTDEFVEAIVVVTCIFLESRFNFYTPKNRKAVNSHVYDILNTLDFTYDTSSKNSKSCKKRKR